MRSTWREEMSGGSSRIEIVGVERNPTVTRAVGKANAEIHLIRGRLLFLARVLR
jgi:hypothetical protein